MHLLVLLACGGEELPETDDSAVTTDDSAVTDDSEVATDDSEGPDDTGEALEGEKVERTLYGTFEVDDEATARLRAERSHG